MIPTERHWRLNERHYGALHGLEKSAIAREFGAEQLQRWRRSYGVRPPPASAADNEGLGLDPRYAVVTVPDSESQANTVARVQPFWTQVLRPALAWGTRALVVALGASLRAPAKLMCGLSGAEAEKFEIPTGIPLIIERDGAGNAKLPYGLYD